MITHISDIILGLAGFSLVLVVFSDVFQSIIVPHYRPTSGRFSAFLVSRLMWKPFTAFIKLLPGYKGHPTLLTLFAPAAMMTLLTSWLGLMITGYSILLWAERSQISPCLKDLPEAIYFAATSVLTIGYGDVVASSVLARITIVSATSSGIILLAITVSFLFAIQSHFHVREVNSQIISSRFDHSSNGAVVYHHLMHGGNLLNNLELCERWIIEVYQSHSAYPLLLYFRSRGSCPAWLSQIGTILDATSIAMTMNTTENRLLLNSIYKNGTRALDVFSNYLRLPKTESDALNPEIYEPMFRALGSLDPVSASIDFSQRRSVYYGQLLALSGFFMIDLQPLGYTGSEIMSSRPILETMPGEVASVGR